MQPRKSHIQFALLAFAAVCVAAVATLYLRGDDESAPNAGLASNPAESRPAPDQGLGGRFLHALRGNLPAESQSESPSPAGETPSVAAEAQPPRQQEAEAVPTAPDGSSLGYVAVEVEAPQPPRRPARLGEADLDMPLPPRRPAALGPAEVAEAPRPPASAPQQARVQPPEPQQPSSWFGQLAATPPPTAAAPEPVLVDAPQPPRRPVRLAALAEAPVAVPTPVPAPVASAPPPVPAPAPVAATQADVAPSLVPPAADQGEPPRGKGRKTAAKPGETAAPAGVQVAALQPEAGLRAAPSEDLQQADQTPQRYNMGAPVFIRIFKKEGELELWVKAKQRYTLYRSFPICKWSGKLGPKLREADYQSPEGFYSVSAKQLNPHSNYHRAFNVGYPNAFDKQNGRTGGLVMVHGNCKSVGCFAMTDKGVEEIYGFVAAALTAGQKEVPVHIFPFRMTEAAIERETGGGFLSFLSNDGSGQRWSGFWRNLKEGYDRFESTREPPTAYACGDHYAFDANGGCSRVAGW